MIQSDNGHSQDIVITPDVNDLNSFSSMSDVNNSPDKDIEENNDDNNNENDFDHDLYHRYLLSLTNEQDEFNRSTMINRMSGLFGKTHDDIYDDFLLILRTVTEQKVKKYHEEKDTFKKAVIKNRIVQWLHSFIKDAKLKDQVIVTLGLKEEETKLYTIENLLELENGHHNDVWLIPGLFRYGHMILLAAQPKAGKTLLANNFALATATGETFLGKKVTKCNVLYIQREESLYQFGQTLSHNGLTTLSSIDPDKYKEIIASKSLIINSNLDIATDLNEIFDIIKAYDIRVLIVDALSSAIRKSGYTEQSEEILGVLQCLQEKCHDYNVFCLLLHHTTKLDDNTDRESALKGVSGKSTILRANDGILKFSQKKTQNGTVKNEYGNDISILSGYVRGVQPFSFEIGLIEEELHWSWQVENETLMPEETLVAYIAIISALKDQHNKWLLTGNEGDPVYGYSMYELSNMLDIEERKMIKMLNYLTKTNAIYTYAANKKHIYCLNEEGVTYLDSHLEDYYAKQEAKRREKIEDRRILNEMLAANSAEEIKSINDELTNAQRKRIQKNMTNDDKKRIGIICNPYEFDINDSVVYKNQEVVIIGRDYDPTLPTISKRCHLYIIEYENSMIQVRGDELKEFSL